MIRSFCIKTNNKSILNYIVRLFKNDTPNNMYLSKNQFKIYENVIFHYVGNNNEYFYNYLSALIKKIILKFYENKLLYNLITYDYFYFTENEKQSIFEIAQELLNENDSLYNSRINTLHHLCLNYIKHNKSMILDGFVNFRLREYSMILNEVASESASTFTIKKEYDEFIELLKSYIETSPCSAKEVHLIYFSNESLLLDEHKNIINIDKNIANAKYLSDISFSSNDYCLNTLLNILPRKIYIHLLNDGIR